MFAVSTGKPKNTFARLDIVHERAEASQFSRSNHPNATIVDEIFGPRSCNSFVALAFVEIVAFWNAVTCMCMRPDMQPSRHPHRDRDDGRLDLDAQLSRETSVPSHNHRRGKSPTSSRPFHRIFPHSASILQEPVLIEHGCSNPWEPWEVARAVG
jgi:hypothetical protein